MRYGKQDNDPVAARVILGIQIHHIISKHPVRLQELIPEVFPYLLPVDVNIFINLQVRLSVPLNHTVAGRNDVALGATAKQGC